MSYILSRKYARKDDPDFVVAAARAFYVDWWANRMEELKRDAWGPGAELTEVAPETARWAFKRGRELALRISWELRRSLNWQVFLPYILSDWKIEGATYKYLDRELSDENLGWYAAMSAMGHGVGLADMGIKYRVPSVEAYPE